MIAWHFLTFLVLTFAWGIVALALALKVMALALTLTLRVVALMPSVACRINVLLLILSRLTS